MASHHHDPLLDEVTVTETSPQGTLADAVEYGHDERDIHVGEILKWLGGLGIGTALVLAFVVFLFGFFNRQAEVTDVLPSPLYKIQGPPHLPRVEGFMPQDNMGVMGAELGHHGEPRAGTYEELKQVRASQVAQLDRLGLGAPSDSDDPDNTDQYYRHGTITPAMASGVAAESPKAVPGSDESFMQSSPTVASGGLAADPMRYGAELKSGK